ncbi:MAG: sigma-70 family RNA polymerase sigma factor [Planctomycetota bacterium]
MPVEFHIADERDAADAFQGGRRQELFLTLLADVEHDLRGYVLALVGNRDDARDVFQEVCVTLWRKFDEFEFGTDFRRWANAIAFHSARSYWRDRGRRREQALSEHALAKLNTVHAAAAELLEIRRRLLQECIGSLGSSDRRLVHAMYFEAESAGDAAERLNVSLQTLYKRLSRLRHRLATCVRRKMA